MLIRLTSLPRLTACPWLESSPPSGCDINLWTQGSTDKTVIHVMYRENQETLWPSCRSRLCVTRRRTAGCGGLKVMVTTHYYTWSASLAREISGTFSYFSLTVIQTTVMYTKFLRLDTVPVADIAIILFQILHVFPPGFVSTFLNPTTSSAPCIVTRQVSASLCWCRSVKGELRRLYYFLVKLNWKKKLCALQE